MNLKRQYILLKKRSTQTYIAKRLGVSQSYISQILNGHRPIPKKYSKKLQKLIKNDYTRVL